MERPMLEHLALRDVVTIRAPTSRSEIVYTISPSLPVKEAAISSAVAGWYRAHLEEPLRGSQSQVLVYVPKKSIGMAIAKELDIPFFESGTPEPMKIKIFDDFRMGRLQMLVATAAFGAGIDIPTVDLVIHAGSPRSMVDFAQESGRAGREGVWGMSVVFRSVTSPTKGENECTGETAMQEWLQVHGPAKCRREGLSEWLDGASVTCASLPRAQLCDNCRGTGIRGSSIKDDLMRAIYRRQNSTLSMESKTRHHDLAPLTPEGVLAEVNVTPIAVPHTPVVYPTGKRQMGSDDHKDGRAKRRALLSSMSTPLSVSATGSTGSRYESLAKSSPGFPVDDSSYADRTLPLTVSLVTMSGVCFLCLGGGRLELCKSQRCASEMKVLQGGSKGILDAVNTLGDAVKFKLVKMEHCGFCYLPVKDAGREFHPAGKGGQCLVFKMMVPKALVYGGKCWVERVQATGRKTDRGDPEWLQDVLVNWRMLPEPSIDNFGRMLLTKCPSGELWLMRVFYHMLEEALRS
jgi:hypothetical protein